MIDGTSGVCRLTRRPDLARCVAGVSPRQHVTVIDPFGLDCRDDQEAIDAGAVIARQIAQDAPPTQARHIEILNSGRQSIAGYQSKG